MRNKLFFILSFLILCVSCERTIEGEQSAFDSNIWTLEEVGENYPKFKVACEILKNDATNQMEAARKLSEEKSKIEGMSAANSIASPVWVMDLSRIDNMIASIQDKVSEAEQLSKEKNNIDALTASQNGEMAIKEAQLKLENAIIKNTSDADAIVNAAVSLLERSERRLDDVLGDIEAAKVNDAPVESDKQTVFNNEKVNSEIENEEKSDVKVFSDKEIPDNTVRVNKLLFYGAVILIVGLLITTLILLFKRKNTNQSNS